MSHCIEENDVVQLGSNKPAWWGFQAGHLWAGCLSPLRCFVEGTGAREMEEVPVTTPDGLTLEGYKAIVGNYSNGNRTALSVVGEDYGLVKDEEFFRILEGVYEGRAVVETAGTLRNGRRIWALVKRDSWDVKTGEKIESYDLWVNRHDGSGCFELHRTNVRVVCQNTWNLAIGNGRNRVFGVRHTRNVAGYIANACNLLKAVNAQEAAEHAKARRLTEVAMNGQQAEAFFRDVLAVKADEKVPTRTGNQLNRLGDLFVSGTGNNGTTRWDAFNAVTEFVDHVRPLRLTAGRNAQEARFESSLLGTGDDLKARAFELLTADLN